MPSLKYFFKLLESIADSKYDIKTNLHGYNVHINKNIIIFKLDNICYNIVFNNNLLADIIEYNDITHFYVTIDDKKHGIYQQYSEGKLCEIGYYKNNVKHGKFIKYTKSFKTIFKIINNMYISITDSLLGLFSDVIIRNYNKNILDGEYFYYRGEDLIEYGIYVNGKLQGENMFLTHDNYKYVFSAYDCISYDILGLKYNYDNNDKFIGEGGIVSINKILDEKNNNYAINRNTEYVWKICKDINQQYVYVKIKLLKDTIYVNTLNRKCRINKGLVVDMRDDNNKLIYNAWSFINNINFKYTLNEIVISELDTDPRHHCSNGISVFVKKEDCDIFRS